MDNYHMSLVALAVYLWFCGGYFMVHMHGMPHKAKFILFWPFIPIKSFVSLFFTTQEELDDMIGECDDDEQHS